MSEYIVVDAGKDWEEIAEQEWGTRQHQLCIYHISEASNYNATYRTYIFQSDVYHAGSDRLIGNRSCHKYAAADSRLGVFD